MSEEEKKNISEEEPIAPADGRYLYRWDYHEQADANERATRAEKRRGVTVYGLIMASVFAACLVVLIGVLGWYQISGNNRLEGTRLPITGGVSNTAAVAATVNPSTVLIQCGSSYGTGFFITENGYIATNYHVVSANEEILVQTYAGKTLRATICGYSGYDDLAVLKIDGHGYPAVTLGDSDAMAVGDSVVVIGHPSGVDGAWSTTQGVISAFNRSSAITAPDDGIGSTTIGYLKMMQTDATVNPGNSGGPICNSRGEVIGVITSKNSRYEGMGYALPINEARVVLTALIEKGSIDVAESPLITLRPFLGITARAVLRSEEYEEGKVATHSGVLVVEVQENGAANGILQADDIIVALNGKSISDNNQLLNRLNEYKVGDTVTLKIIRGGEEKTVSVTLKAYTQ